MRLTQLNTTRVQKFARLSAVQDRRIYIVGSSGAGKSTLWRSLRSIGVPGAVFPTRYISRAGRPDDMPDENVHLDGREFAARVCDGRLEFYWPKHLPGGDELYGFARARTKLAVYGCNNEFVLNSAELVSRRCIFLDYLVVFVSATPSDRRERLSARSASHAISRAEMDYRFCTASHDDAVRERSDIEVHNDYSDMRPLVAQLVGDLLLDQEGHDAASS